MVKIFRPFAIISLLVFSMFAVIAFSGCEKEQLSPPKPSCASDEDCTSSKACTEARCVMGECVTRKLDDCCGNGVCEDSSQEDICGCPDDCEEPCEGNVEFTLPGNQKRKAKYFDWGCSKDRCIIRYDTAEIDPREEYIEVSKDSLLFGLTINYIQPFVIKQQDLSIEIELKDFDAEKIDPPIRINEIRIMEGTLLLGRVRNINRNLQVIGNDFTQRIPISYSMSIPEEQKTVSIEIDYQYDKHKKVKVTESDGTQAVDGDGNPIYEYVSDGMLISKDKKTLRERIYFLDPDYNEVKVDFSQD